MIGGWWRAGGCEEGVRGGDGERWCKVERGQREVREDERGEKREEKRGEEIGEKREDERGEGMGVGKALGGSLERFLKCGRVVNLNECSVMFYDFLFPQSFRGKGVSALILVLRVFFGILFFLHGLDKLVNFNTLVVNYPNILGFGSYMTLMVTVFTEFCCSLFLLAGLMQRIVTIPMFLSMAVAFFDVHEAVLPEGELALIYFIVFLGLFIVGPGRYSVDYLIDRRVRKDVDSDKAVSKRSCGCH